MHLPMPYNYRGSRPRAQNIKFNFAHSILLMESRNYSQNVREIGVVKLIRSNVVVEDRDLYPALIASKSISLESRWMTWFIADEHIAGEVEAGGEAGL